MFVGAVESRSKEMTSCYSVINLIHVEVLDIWSENSVEQLHASTSGFVDDVGGDTHDTQDFFSWI